MIKNQLKDLFKTYNFEMIYYSDKFYYGNNYFAIFKKR
jgi:hypothetical protein